MADLLTHLFLPLTVVYVLRRDLFESPAHLGLAGFAVLSDFDKFLGTPGLLHSLVTLVPIAVAVAGAERLWRGRLEYAPAIVALLFSHLVLDLLDGGPVPLLFPLVTAGVGLQYPAQTAFGQGPLGLWIDGPLVALRTAVPRQGFNTYGFLTGVGVAIAAAFATVYVGLERGAGERR